jgi:GTP pyrophosphokinase
MTAQVREAVAQPDAAQWLSTMRARLPEEDLTVLERALHTASTAYTDRRALGGESLLSHCREVADILAELRLDGDSIAAALLSGLPTVDPDWHRNFQESVSAPIATLVDGFARMGQIQSLRSLAPEARKAAERGSQLESLRKMLLAMVQDARVVLLKLADQLQVLRYLAGRGDPAARLGAARDTLELFAPLANRLGIWQLKWELEDLAFRCSEPETYKHIARELDEKRIDREAFIAHVVDTLRVELERAGIDAEVSGRPKHIFSIYKKLSRKDLSLKDLFDVRGVRILVDDVKGCYTALGLVHHLWTPLPKEFDDYIAKPKPNNYRSLHSAVVGPDQKVLEVQIRTHEMHHYCEYGVAAHWRYKEGVSRDTAFEERIGWLRQILEWKDGLADVADLTEYFRTGLSEENVYVLTPQGRVVDLPRGSTPVDFAYYVHTELGHRCRGARVDGEMVPLTYALSNGQTVEILTAKSGGPSRDWLNPELAFIQSSRARAKVRQWFNNQNLESAIAHGREVLEKLLQREGRTALRLDVLAGRAGHKKIDDLLATVGRGEYNLRQLEQAIRGESEAPAPEAALPTPVNRTAAEREALRKGGDVLVVGVDKLLTVLAKCCKPAPPDRIIGFVTRGRGVTVHRQSCTNLPRLAAERLIIAEWGGDAEQGRFAVDVEVDGAADPTLMRDVLDVFSREKVRVAAASSTVQDLSARMFFTVEVNGLAQIRRLLGIIGELPGVSSSRRR